MATRRQSQRRHHWRSRPIQTRSSATRTGLVCRLNCCGQMKWERIAMSEHYAMTTGGMVAGYPHLADKAAGHTTMALDATSRLDATFGGMACSTHTPDGSTGWALRWMAAMHRQTSRAGA